MSGPLTPTSTKLNANATGETPSPSFEDPLLYCPLVALPSLLCAMHATEVER